MAMNLPVVTTDVAGAKELVVNGETGFVLPQGEAEQLGQAIITLAADDELRLRMGRAGRERVEKEFSFILRLGKIEDLYEWLLGSASNLRSQSRHAESRL